MNISTDEKFGIIEVLLCILFFPISIIIKLIDKISEWIIKKVW
jgi:hypothetical protein